MYGAKLKLQLSNCFSVHPLISKADAVFRYHDLQNPPAQGYNAPSKQGVIMSILNMQDVDLNNKRVMIREDFNVPIENGTITSDARIQAALPTIRYALEKNASVILISHLGRPQEDEYQAEYSLAPIAAHLTKLLNRPVKFISNWLDGFDIQPGEIVLCENTRFEKGEKKNDPILSKKMAALCDVFVMDAFATAHRAECSTTGVAEFAPVACAGLLLAKELDALHRALEKPARPLLAIIGGSKVSSKLWVLNNLITKVNQLIVGGGIANTFLAAKGFPIGKSLYEANLIPEAKNILARAEQQQVEILLPFDVVVADEFAANAQSTVKSIRDVTENDMILDVGPQTAHLYAAALEAAGTILWNGPVGVFEFAAFENGTKTLAEAIAATHAFSIAGGGDTIAAIEKYNIADKISYISTGGGAFLEYVEGKELPAVKALERE